jgi:hypothetical protein
MSAFGPVIYTVRSMPMAGHEDEFDRWQNEEHVPNLLAVPGYRGVMRFRELARDRAWMNVWDIGSKADFESGARWTASRTPWRLKIDPIREEHRVDFYEAEGEVRPGMADQAPIAFLLRHDVPALQGAEVLAAALADTATVAARLMRSTSLPGEALILQYLAAQPASGALGTAYRRIPYPRLAA